MQFAQVGSKWVGWGWGWFWVTWKQFSGYFKWSFQWKVIKVVRTNISDKLPNGLRNGLIPPIGGGIATLGLNHWTYNLDFWYDRWSSWELSILLWPATLTSNPSLAKVKVDAHAKNPSLINPSNSRAHTYKRTEGYMLPNVLSPCSAVVLFCSASGKNRSQITMKLSLF